MAGVAGPQVPRGEARIGLIVTEHPSYTSPAQQAEVAGLAAQLARAGNREVSVSRYLDPWDLEGVGTLVLSGSHAPWSEHRDQDLAEIGERVKSFGGPVFGICAGMQLLALFEGASFRPCRAAEKGFTMVTLDTGSGRLGGLPQQVEVYQNHTDEVTDLPASVVVLARNDACEVQALEVSGRPWWGTQFHPELADRQHPDGYRILERAVRLATEDTAPMKEESA